MNILGQLWSLLGSAILLVGVYLLAQILPQYKWIMPPSNYHDVGVLPLEETSGLDATVGIRQLQQGDLIAFDTGRETVPKHAYGYVLGLPGEVVALGPETATANGDDLSRGRSPPHLGATDWLPVPADHVYVLSDRNRHDSTAYGPIPASQILGRIKE